MGQALQQAGDAEPLDQSEPAVDHGEQRWEAGWSLAELVRDYQILQLVILEHLEENLGRPLRCREAMAVGVFIDDAVAAAIAAYVASRENDARRAARERVEVLQAASRRKDEFLAMLAHELRNPLAPIQDAVLVLQSLLAAADPAVLEPIRVVERQTRLLTRLVDDLLDLGRVTRNQLELRRGRLDLAAVVRQAVQVSEPLLKGRGHHLEVALPPEPLVVEGDEARLVQVVVNLLNNAAKYTDPGGRVWVAGERDGADTVVRVRDSGVGIPPEMRARVFDLFTQLEGSRDHAQGGLGIGLALVRRLVELHGGAVACDSDGPGCGSEFVVRLPAAAGPLPPPTAPAVPPPASAGCHVLIVEDYADARNTLAALLKLLGHRVELAENGTTGVERALATRPQAALVDVGLPDFDGYEVARRLRAAFDDRIFLVALTGHGQSDDLRQALDAGFDAHLVKPADPEELARLLARVAAGK
jgi:signal transduction histidine kinase/CheY-like chemotaxis protein